MKSETAVAVFVKTPGLSAIKSRLATRLGVEKSEIFYSLSCKNIEFNLLKEFTSDDVDLYWAVAEPEGLESAHWKRFKRIDQGIGALGDRLNHVDEEMRKNYRNLIFIGGDCPQINTKLICSTIDRLNQGSSFVLGPARDGGYYLFGSSKRVGKKLWKSVPYSQPNTFVEFKKHLQKLSKVDEIEMNYDIDEIKDLIDLKTQSRLGDFDLSMELKRFLQNEVSIDQSKLELQS